MTSREGGRKKRSFVGLRKDAGNEKKKKREKEDDDEKKKNLGLDPSDHRTGTQLCITNYLHIKIEKKKTRKFCDTHKKVFSMWLPRFHNSPNLFSSILNKELFLQKKSTLQSTFDEW